MEEKKEVKVKLSTLFLLFIICALVVALGVVYYLGFVKDQKQENNNQAKNVSAINETKESDNKNVVNDVKKEEKNVEGKDDLVTTAYHHVYDTSQDYSVTIDIPQINLEFDNIKKLNKEIYDELYIAEDGDSQIVHNVEYKVYLNGNILSLVIIRETETDSDNYIVYNIDILTGNSIANDEIIRIKGMTSSEYEEKMREVCENTFKTRFSDLYANDEMLLYDTLTYWNRNTPMFLDDDNTINVIAKYYTDIGSGYVIDILDTQI